MFNINVGGKKINEDGTLREFRGNTIICPLSDVPSCLKKIRVIQEQIKQFEMSDRFVFLPIASLHITIFELVCDQVRESKYWSKYLALDTVLEETDDFFCEHFKKLKKPSHLSMVSTGIKCDNILSIRLSPSGISEKKKLVAYRDALSRATGIKFPDHNHYEFHITLAYRFKSLTATESLELSQFLKIIFKRSQLQIFQIQLNSPKLTFFENMGNFYG